MLSRGGGPSSFSQVDAGGDVEFRILWPLTVERAGQDIPVASAKLRTVLAYLLTHARQLVTRDGLVEEVWGTLRLLGKPGAWGAAHPSKIVTVSLCAWGTCRVGG